MKVAIIPARGGSKRIQGKNIKQFVGKPIIAYSIQAAVDSGVFDRIIVTTDSKDIALVAEQYGAEVPFFRPKKISDDHTPTAPVLTHAIEWLKNNGENPEFACCIYATAPFTQPEYIREGLKKIEKYQCASSYSITTFPFPIFRGLKINDSGCLEMVWPENEMVRSQDLPETYHDVGQFYWLDCEKFLQEPRVYAKDSRPVLIPRHLAQDIDTVEDWVRAEYMYKALVLGAEEEAK